MAQFTFELKCRFSAAVAALFIIGPLMAAADWWVVHAALIVAFIVLYIALRTLLIRSLPRNG